MPMSPRLLRPIASRSLVDADAAAYLTAVETADTQALEPAVRNAITAFIVGCKADGIWNAIKASCILMGARTLSGALTPLKGGAPTNVNNNFVSGDYNRETGLKGNGTTKYLNSNRNNNADPQDNHHNAAYVSEPQTSGTAFYLAARVSSGNLNGQVNLASVSGSHFVRNRSNTGFSLSGTPAGFFATARSVSSEFISRNGGVNTTHTNASQTPADRLVAVFGLMDGNNSDAGFLTTGRLAFYSIGESLDLALLDTRVTALYNAIGSAI
jgi:hypothetical protein